MENCLVQIKTFWGWVTVNQYPYYMSVSKAEFAMKLKSEGERVRVVYYV